MKTLIKIFGVIVLIYSWLPGMSQTQISGTINRYAKVNTVNGPDNVTVSLSEVTNFAVDDTALIIQMKGADIYTLSGQNSLLDMNSAGRYEFIAIQQVNYGTGVIKFRSNFLNTYNASQALQLVRVPFYQNAKVVSPGITCKPWDGNSGGVLALMVADTLDLQADITASGKGFQGGAVTPGDSTCIPYSAKRYFLATAIDSAGLKGEGISETSFALNYKRGKGALANAGGGGNGFGAGGGGGSGRNTGGMGGQASVACPGRLPSELDAGEGGFLFKDYFAGDYLNSDLRDRLFMGGGGGASRGKNIGDASPGGNGGGIVFIMTYNLKNNGKFIRSNGDDAGTAINNAGAGGGGAGGSIMLSINNTIDLPNIEAKGGKGGNAGCTGRGGGGGGGFVWFSDFALNFSSLNYNAGLAGSYTSASCSISITPATNGNPGDSANRLNPVLNGFLFNLIGSSQIACYGVAPKKFTGTRPRGGNGIYTYQWQYRNKSTSNKWQNVSGANSMEYQSPGLTDTTDFRRVVSSIQLNTGTPVSDSSKWIRVKVKPEIKGLSIAPADTAMCFGQSSINIRGSVAYGGDGSALVYKWQESIDNSTWIDATVSPINQRDYAGTSNQTTKYYRRNITNSECTVTSNSSRIIVYPLIQGNKLQPDTVICKGATPHPMRGDAVLTGGSGIYKYQWLKNTTDSIHWAPTSAADTFATYNPGPLNDTVFYKRIVYSGLRNTCSNTSARIKITVLLLISNNSITQNQTICENTSPQRFIGTMPSGGDKNYRYQWEISGDNSTWTPIQSPAMNVDSINFKYGPISPAVPNYFRRTIFSGGIDNKVCVSYSPSIKMTVQPKIQNNIIADSSEICFGQTSPGLAQKSGSVSGGDNTTYIYLWQKKIQGGSWKDSTGTNQTSFQPGKLFKTTYFRRKVNSGTCVSFSDSLKINVLDTINGNQLKPGGPHEVCENTTPGAFIGPNITGGKPGDYRYFWDLSENGTTWNNIATAHDKDYTSPALTKDTYFRRTVKSGYNNCCISVGDTFVMKVSKHPSIPEAGNDQKLSFKFTTKLHAKPVQIGWGVWSVKDDAIVIDFPKDTASQVENLPFGKTVFYWTTHNGSCPIVTDTVIIEVDDIKRFNGFSPNGDASNEFFKIEGAENSIIKKLKIFNRWGAEVYSSDNYQNDWNGNAKNGQPLPDDTYYYIFEADGNRIYKGFVVIKR